MRRPKGGEDREGSRSFGALLLPGEERQGRATVRTCRAHRVNDTHGKALSLVTYLGPDATSVQEGIKRSRTRSKRDNCCQRFWGFCDPAV